MQRVSAATFCCIVSVFAAAALVLYVELYVKHAGDYDAMSVDFAARLERGRRAEL